MRITELNINLKTLAATAGVLVIGAILYSTKDIVLMFFIAMLIAYILNPIVNLLGKIHISRTIGVFILVLFTASIFTLVLAVIIPVLIDDIIYFANRMPEYIAKIFAFIERVITYLGIEVSLDTIKAFVMERLGLISKYILNTVTTAAASVKGIVMLLLNLFLIPVLVFFLLKDFPKVREFTNRIVDRFNLQKTVAHIEEFERIIGKYFRGMFFVGLVLSALYTAVLMIVGVKGAIFLGLLTGMGGMIPYVGFAVGLIVSLTMTAVQFQDFLHPIYILAGFTIVQVLESTVITPKIVGDSLGLNPVIVIVALMIGGALLGLIGMIIALPIAAFIKIMMDKHLFNKNSTKSN